MKKRSSDELIQALETHSVEGYPVHDPIFGPAFIVRQGGSGPTLRYTDTAVEKSAPQISYVTRPARKFTFQEWVKARHLGTEPMNLEQWKEKFGRYMRGEKLPVISEVYDALEGGARISEAEAEHERLKFGDQLGPGDTVLWNVAQANQVWIPADELKKGMLVEVNASDGFYGNGRIVGHGKNPSIVLLELFTPVSYFSATDAIANEEVRPGFFSANTYSLGYGTLQAMEDQNVPIPPGKFLDAKEKEWILDELMPVSKIEEFCQKFYPQAPLCTLQSKIYYILPLHTTGKYKATFHPLPEKFLTSEYVVTYD